MKNPLPDPVPHHQNGHASPAAIAVPESNGDVERRPTVRPANGGRGSDDLSLAIRTGQENLESLQRLAEQTAELHRLFLEGQEKTQQTFLKLLEQQQALARRRILSPAAFDPVFSPALRLPSPAVPSPAKIAPPPSPTLRNGSDPVEAPASPALGRHEVAATNGHAPAEPAVRTPQKPLAARDEAIDALRSVVSDKTGYPEDVLGPEMRLDDDLGIDSIKRVEILSALQERYPGLPAPSPEQLASFRTLGAIADFLQGAGPVVKEVPPPAVIGPGLDEVAKILLATVAEKTGYPAEMLELSMRLDADLGIDSIKRVEILSTLQEHLPWSSTIGPEVIGALGTLGDVAETIFRSRTNGRSERAEGSIASTPAHFDASPATVAPIESLQVASAGSAVARVLIEAVAEKTGYPAEMLELSMRLDDDLGIDSIKRVEILSAVQDRLPGTPAIGPEQAGTLHTLGEIAAFLSNPVEPAADDPATARNTGPACEAVVRSAEAPDEPALALTRLVARPRPLSNPDARERVALPAGGVIAILDGGSALTEAIRIELDRRGYRPRVIGERGASEIAAEPDLCGLIALAPKTAVSSDFVGETFRAIRAAAPALERSARRGGASLLTVSHLDGRFGVEGLRPEVDPTSAPWPASPRRLDASTRESLARRSTWARGSRQSIGPRPRSSTSCWRAVRPRWA